MAYVTHPDAPEKDEAWEAATDLAADLRVSYPEYPVRVVEHIGSRYEVVVEVPFRVEHLTWAEREAKQ